MDNPKLCPHTLTGKHIWDRSPFGDYPRCKYCNIWDDTYVLTEEDKQERLKMEKEREEYFDQMTNSKPWWRRFI